MASNSCKPIAARRRAFALRRRLASCETSAHLAVAFGIAPVADATLPPSSLLTRRPGSRARLSSQLSF